MLNNLNDNILDSESILDTKLQLCKNNKKRQDVFIAWYFFKLLFIYLFVLKMERNDCPCFAVIFHCGANRILMLINVIRRLSVAI